MLHVAMHSVLFVCTANRIRSPLAQGLFVIKLGDQLEEWQIDSAGTWTVSGLSVSPYVVEILTRRGVDLSWYKTKQIDSFLIRRFNLILTMESGQKEALRIEFPQYKHRIYQMSEMVGRVFDIEDPNQNYNNLQDTVKIIEYIFNDGFEMIFRLSMG